VSSGCEAESTQIVQVEKCEFTFPLVAAAHYGQGPVRRVIVGSDFDLACQVAAHLSQDKTPAKLDAMDSLSDQPDSGAETITEARSGFGMLCEFLRDELYAAMREADLRKEFAIHDPGRFQVLVKTERQFHITVATGKGDFQLLVGMATRSELTGQPHRAFDGPVTKLNSSLANYTIDYSEDIQNIVNNLVTHEEDVYLRLPAGDGRHKVYHATVLELPRGSQRRDLSLTSSCLFHHDARIGQDVSVLFIRHGRLLQFQSLVQAHSQAFVGKSAYLPLLQVDVPNKITPGQRRDAFRIVPDTEVTGSIRSPLVLKGPGKSEKRQVVPFVVRDLSFTGARVEIQSNTLLSGFRWGREVECNFELPEPHGTVKVVAVVHRLDLYPKKRAVKCAQLGIEFIRERQKVPHGMEIIRQYVLDQERLTLKRRTELGIH
jgi:hypothetical protein